MKTIKKLFFVTLMGCLVVQGFAQVNKTVRAGEVFTISNATSATPGSTYRWMVNGAVIPSATASSYSGSITTMGTYMFIRQAMKTGLCDEWMSSNPYVVAVTCGATLTTANASQTICAGSAIGAIKYTTSGVSSASQVTVSNLPSGLSASWASNTLTISGTPSENGNFTVNLCGTDVTTGSITRQALPTISHVTSSGSPTQTVSTGTAISAIKFYATNAGSITPSGALPAGLSASYSANTYTIYGTPNATGAYTVTTTNSNGCANATASGTITVQPAVTYTGCTPATFTLGTVDFTSSATYSRNGLTISSPVTATYCNGREYSTFDSGSSGAYKADCAKNYYDVTYGNWFSWCAVKQYAAELCPSPWRVPTKEDHCLLVNGSTTNCSELSSSFNNVDGYALAGRVNNGAYYSGGEYGYYWSSTQVNMSTAYYLYFNSATTSPVGNHNKLYGFSLRCVQ